MTRLAGAHVHVHRDISGRLRLTAYRRGRTASVLVSPCRLDHGLDDLDDILEHAPDHPIAAGWRPAPRTAALLRRAADGLPSASDDYR